MQASKGPRTRGGTRRQSLAAEAEVSGPARGDEPMRATLRITDSSAAPAHAGMNRRRPRRARIA